MDYIYQNFCCFYRFQKFLLIRILEIQSLILDTYVKNNPFHTTYLWLGSGISINYEFKHYWCFQIRTCLLAARLEDWKKARSDEWKEVYRLDGISGGKICLGFSSIETKFSARDGCLSRTRLPRLISVN